MSHSGASQGKKGSSWGAGAEGHLMDEEIERREAVGCQSDSSVIAGLPIPVRCSGTPGAKVLLVMGR